MKTDITFLLDRSGSMNGLVDDTIGGFNSLLADQKRVEGEAVVTLCQFDDEFQTDYEGVPIVEAADLDRTTYVPRGATALLDAIGRTISMTKARLAKTPADNVMIIVITDGQENRSKEFNKDQIKALVEEIQKNSCKSCGAEVQGWNFIFTGANMDAIEEGTALGVSFDSSLTYQATSPGTQTMYTTVSRGMSASRVTGQSVSFNTEDRSANS